MTDRVMAGARVSVDIHDLHTRNVREKHEVEDLYKGIEAENAIREYLDQDDLVESEDRLREWCTEIGCSPPKEKKLVSDGGANEKKLAQWRIRQELKDDLKAYAKENEQTYGDVFALAIREHWTNSRADRLEALIDRLDSAIEPWTEEIGSDGVNVGHTDRTTTQIAMELSFNGDALPRSEIEEVIAEVTSDSKYNREKYTPLVAEHKGLEEHPNAPEKLFVTHERAEELREDEDETAESSVLDQPVAGLSPDERILRVQARGFKKALSNKGKASLKARDVHNEFNRDISKTTAYNLMERAGEASGFDYGKWHGTKKVRIDAKHVDDKAVVAAVNTAGESEPTEEERVSAEMERLSGATVGQ